MTGTLKPLTARLLRQLGDGEFHSGQILALHEGVSRSSVCNALRDVADLGLELFSVRGRGYCLARPIQWLDAGRITDLLGESGEGFSIEIIDSAPSSNTLLLQRSAQGAPTGSVLAVEWQSGGRGRQGRAWHAGLGASLTFSLLWRFDCGLSGLSGLSLAVGVGIMRALHRIGARHAGLKWPNDVMAENGKLAGILIEAQGDMLGPSAAVIGIGLNVSLPGSLGSRIDQPAASLSESLQKMPDRNHLLAILLQALHEVMNRFAKDGFSALRTEWERHHLLQGSQVTLRLPDASVMVGTVKGVSDDGSLELVTEQGLRRFNSGEISLRSGI